MVSATGENLVFLFSTPRSGSTLLGAMLGSHRAIACPPEPWFLLRLAATYAPATHRGWHDDAMAAIATRKFLSPDAFRGAARAFAVSAYNEDLKHSGRRIFVDKTPRYYHILDFLGDLFPQARQLWLQRNPLAVAASFKRTWDIGVDVLTGRCVTPHTFDLVLALRCFARHFGARSPLQLEVQYERLVSDPEGELRRICAFLDVPFDESMLRYGDNVALMDAYHGSVFGDRSVLDHTAAHRNAVDRWRQVLSPDEIEQITRALGPDIFTRMGYEGILPEGAGNGTATDGPVAAVLARDFSPAEPLHPACGPAAEVVSRTLEGAETAGELARAWDERDRLEQSYRELEANRDYYRNAYETMVTDRDRWQAAHNAVEANRDYYRSAYETMVAERDRWQAAHNAVEANRDYYRSAYETMVADRDRWQAAHNAMEANRDYYRSACETMVAERDRWQAACNEAEAMLRSPPLRLAISASRWLARLRRLRGRQA